MKELGDPGPVEGARPALRKTKKPLLTAIALFSTLVHALMRHPAPTIPGRVGAPSWPSRTRRRGRRLLPGRPCDV